MHFSFTDQLVELGYVWRLLQKDNPYNRHDQCLLEFQFLRMKVSRPASRNGPRAETGRTQSGTLLRNEVKQMRGATGLTVLALLLRASLPCAATCELAGKCKQSANEWS